MQLLIAQLSIISYLELVMCNSTLRVGSFVFVSSGSFLPQSNPLSYGICRMIESLQCTLPKKCNTLKDEFIVLQIHVTDISTL